jgi:hypothetical protein
MRKALLAILVLFPALALGDWYTEDTVAPTKVDAKPLPPGANASRFIRGSDWNNYVKAPTELLRTKVKAAQAEIDAEEATRAAADTSETAARVAADASETTARALEDASIRAQVASVALGGGVNIADTSTVLGAGASFPLLLKDWLSLHADVRSHNAKCDGETNDTVAFESAFATGKKVLVPAGTCLVNARVTKEFVIEGAGSFVTFLKPFNPAVAALTYSHGDQAWTYHSEVRNLGFLGTAKIGVGFTFGRTNPNDYQAGDEYSNGVTFRNVYFKNLQKGVQFPSGNIGSEFYSCGFSGNKYGVYSINNKFGGDLMHAGNKYFFGGEMNSNEVGVYVHNTADGFGGFSFDGVIFEGNSINTYFYTTNVMMPVRFKDVWSEANGTLLGGGPTQVTIDAWAGSVRSDLVVDVRAYIFDGTKSSYVWEGGFFSDVNLLATDSRVIARNVRGERDAGTSGKECSVASSSSEIRIETPYTDGGLPRAQRVLTVGAVDMYRTTIDANQSSSGSRWYRAPHRHSKVSGQGASGLSLTFATQQDTGGGSFNATGTVVADGVLYGSANEYVLPFTGGGQYTRLMNGRLTPTVAGWYVFTLDVKVISGEPPNFYVWDRADAILASAIKTEVGTWQTVAGMGYSPGGQTLDLDIGGTAAVTLRLSAYQIRRFDTKQEAQAFLASGVFVEP